MAKPGEKIAIVGAGLVIAFMLAVGLKTCYQRTTSTGPFRQELSGRILDKFIQTLESDEGSRLTHYLLIAESDGRQTRIAVSGLAWQEARAGQWFVKDRQGVRILANAPPTPSLSE